MVSRQRRRKNTRYHHFAYLHFKVKFQKARLQNFGFWINIRNATMGNSDFRSFQIRNSDSKRYAVKILISKTYTQKF